MRFVTLRWASLATVLSMTLATVAMPAVAEAASSTSISMGVTTPLAAGGLETLKHSMGADISACSLVSSVRGSHDRSTALTCVAKAGRHTTLPFAVAGKTPTTPSISNLPATAIVGGSFTATISTTSDGAKSIKSTTTAVCSVTGIKVTYLTSGTCSLIASVAASSHYKVANGAAQSFVILGKTPTTPSISNLPATAIVGGSFTAAISTTSDGAKSIKSTTTTICSVTGFKVTYLTSGTCSLTASVAASSHYKVANGAAQRFVVAVKTPTPTNLTGKTIVSDGAGYCALLTSGRVDCWGYGPDGELGNGQSNNSNVPVAVVSTSGSGTTKCRRSHLVDIVYDDETGW